MAGPNGSIVRSQSHPTPEAMREISKVGEQLDRARSTSAAARGLGLNAHDGRRVVRDDYYRRPQRDALLSIDSRGM
jgi:hypothetical protein